MAWSSLPFGGRDPDALGRTQPPLDAQNEDLPDRLRRAMGQVKPATYRESMAVRLTLVDRHQPPTVYESVGPPAASPCSPTMPLGLAQCISYALEAY